MKLIVFSDAHVHAWTEHSVLGPDGVPSRLNHCLEVFRRVRHYAIANEIAVVLFAGDAFHKRGVLYTLPYNLLVRELATWRDEGLTLLANTGNHDSVDRMGKTHALQALDSAGLLHCVPERGWQTWEIGDDEVAVAAVAYCPDVKTLRERTEQALAELADADVKVGLYHHGFKGARVGTSLEYVVPEDAEPDEIAKAFDVVFVGHYHAHQPIGSGTNAWYVGSPMEFVRGETSPKGFLILDTSTGELEQVPIALPRFVRVTAEQLADPTFDVNAACRGNFVDVVFEDLPFKWEDLEWELKSTAGAEGVRAVPLKSTRVAKSSRLDVDASLSERELLERYLEHKKDDITEFDRNELLRVGLDLLNK